MLGEADAPARLDALHNLGDVARAERPHRRGDARTSWRCSRLAWRYDNLNKAGAAYSRLARGQRRLGKYDAAMEHLRRAHELFERSRDDRGIASTLDDMGRVHWLRGAYGQALDFHRQALTIRRALGDRRSIALSLANIGRVHHDTRQLQGGDRAVPRGARSAARHRRSRRRRAVAVRSRRRARRGRQPRARAIELLGEARTIAQEIGDKLALADVLSRSGEVKGAMGRGAEAVKDLVRGQAARVERSAIASRSRSRTSGSRRCSSQLGNLEAADVEAHAAVAVSEAGRAARAHRLRLSRARRRSRPRSATRSRPRTTSGARSISSRRSRTRSSSRARIRASRRSRSAPAPTPRRAKLRGRAVDIFTRLRGAAATE